MAATLLAYLLLLVVKLGVYHFDVSRFVVAGDRFFSVRTLTYPIAVEPHSVGYDGQFFYRLALDPATTTRRAYGITMEEHPVVRAQRIGYPVAAWALSLGRSGLVPYTLVLVNLLALAAMAWTATRLAAAFGVAPRLGLLIPFYPGFVLSFCRDTAEILAAALALGALLMATRARWPLAALLATAAVLTRETTLPYLAGFGLVAVIDAVRRRVPDRRIAWCLVPLLVAGAWQVTLRAIWGSYAFDDLGHHDLSILPLVDYARGVATFAAAAMTPPIRYGAMFSLVSCVCVPAFVLFVAAGIARRRRLPLPFLVPWLLYAGLAAIFTDAIWVEPYGYLRILCDLYVLGIASLIAVRAEAALRRLVPFVATIWIAAFAFVL